MAFDTALRKSWRAAPAVSTLVAAAVLVWLAGLMTQWSSAMVVHAAFLPERLEGFPGDEFWVPAWLTPISTLFVHAGFIHLALSLVALFVFGRAIETAVGSIGFLLLYLAGALVAAATFFWVHPTGLYWVGAGGGIGALLGAYAMLFGRSRAPTRAGMGRWSYTLWLCVGWTLLVLLVTFAYADWWAIYYAAATIASFVIGLPLGRLLLLYRYRKA